MTQPSWPIGGCGRSRKLRLRRRNPERVEAFRRNVGQPKAEEYEVVFEVRGPLEEIRLDKLHTALTNPGLGPGKHLGCSVHGCDLGPVTQQPLRPSARTAGELKYLCRSSQASVQFFRNAYDQAVV
jgi:hypothetical protein